MSDGNKPAVGFIPTQFPLKHVHKDIGLALSESAVANAPLPLTAAQHDHRRHAAGLGEQGMSAVAALAKKLT